MHALSPGHGKTVVGAYLVGARGTPRHALFLGLTVTIVHTAGVFALGLATLTASRSVVPERIFPWLSLISGLLVLAMGLGLVRARLSALRWRAPAGQVSGAAAHGTAALDHEHDHDGAEHSHGFGAHTHAVPGVDGAPVTWRGLLALGISGGLLPCPSALVLMLGAIALQQIALGLVLIVAFSAGLAATLTAIGLAMVYSGRLAGHFAGRLHLTGRAGRAVGPVGRLVRAVPVLSAGVVALAGLALAVEAVGQIDGVAGMRPVFDTPAAYSAPLTALSAILAIAAASFWLRSRRPQRWPTLVTAAPGPAEVGGHGHRSANVPGHGHGGVHGRAHGHGHDHGHSHDRGHGHAHGHADHETTARPGA
jgi:ABC-type nickel/cobalt efflux system permease component RcnA